MIIAQLDSIIKSSKNILIVSHVNPDGDTLGSMCGLYSLIKDNYKKKCDMLAVSLIPDNYKFIPHIKNVINIENIDLSREYDLVINVDIAEINRCANAKILFEKAKNTINIDHHETNNGYGEINIIEPKASATGEVLYNIAQNLDWKVSKDSAVCLYTAILTDTGSFKFSNTTPQTMKIASELLTLGIDNAEIYKKCYESSSKNMILFQSYCVGKAKFLNNDKIAYTLVYKKDLEKFNNKGEDFTDGLTEKLRAIKTTEIAFVLKEAGSNISKLSMRSKQIDISKICKALNGGGHKFAAGAVIKANINNALKIVLEEIERQCSKIL